MAVYIASPHRLPPIAWDEAAPAFYVEEAPPDDAVRARFSHPNVYFAGAHEGCGCGFRYGVYPATDDDDRRAEEQGRESVAKLREYLNDVARAVPVELYACWEGEQALPVEKRSAISVDQVGGDSFEFTQRRMLDVRAD